jgi:AMIN domain
LVSHPTLIQFFNQMSRPSLKALLCFLTLCVGLTSLAAHPQSARETSAAVIRRVALLGRGNDVELEIAASQQVTPQTQVLTGPDRVVIDFPGAMPAAQLRPLAVNRGDVKAVRVGLFAANPPITRVVVDLKSPQGYQVFPTANTVIVKLGSLPKPEPKPEPVLTPNGFIGAIVAGHPQISPPVPHPAAAAKPAALVSFQNGLLSVRAEKATLAQVLFEVHQQTGADISVPAGAEQEPVVADLGPAPTKDVLAALLNGTNYNFIFLGAAGDSKVDRVIISAKSVATESYVPPPQPPQPDPAPPIPEPQPTAVIPPPDVPADQVPPPPDVPPPN